MHRYSKLSLIAIAVATAGIGAATCAYADKGMENDALTIVSAKISLTQAITTAERHVNGKAARAEYERSRQGAAYEVEVVSGAKVFDVKVDADKGSVISSAEDKADHEHGDKDD